MDKVEAEYSLRDVKKPIGISEYKLTQALPKNFKSQLPTIAEIENQLEIDVKKVSKTRTKITAKKK